MDAIHPMLQKEVVLFPKVVLSVQHWKARDNALLHVHTCTWHCVFYAVMVILLSIYCTCRWSSCMRGRFPSSSLCLVSVNRSWTNSRRTPTSKPVPHSHGHVHPSWYVHVLNRYSQYIRLQCNCNLPMRLVWFGYMHDAGAHIKAFQHCRIYAYMYIHVSWIGCIDCVNIIHVPLNWCAGAERLWYLPSTKYKYIHVCCILIHRCNIINLTTGCSCYICYLCSGES
jgi:hypothetical protein